MKRAFILIVVLGIIGAAATLSYRFRGSLGGLLPGSWSRPTFTFAVIGDTESHTDLFAKALESAQSHGAALMLHTGDVTDSGTADEFAAIRTVITKATIPVYAAVGNHDIRTDDTRGLFREALNAPNVAIDAGGLRFVLLDNAERKIGFSPETLAWLRADIDTHPEARYVIAYHRPFGMPFGSIVGDDETTASRQTDVSFRSIIAHANVAAIFNGHIHSYIPFSFGGTPAYVTGGGGGPAQEGLAGFAKAPHHYLLVKVTGGTIHAEVVSLD